MLSRPSDRGHTPFGDMFYSESPDMAYWGRHRFVMGTKHGWQKHQDRRRPDSDRDNRGLVALYHGVLTSCNGYVYSFGAALLDLDQPWKVIYRTAPYLPFAPNGLRVRGRCAECRVPVCGAHRRADRAYCHLLWCRRYRHWLVFGYVDEILAYLKDNSEV